MSVNVEQLLCVIELLAKTQAELTNIRQRLRDDAQAFADMNLKVQQILNQRRKHEAETENHK